VLAYDYENCFDALGDRTRREIFEQVGRGPSSVVDLASTMPVSRPAVSQHLRVLKEAGLVTCDTIGTRNIYRIDMRGVTTMRVYLERFWGDALQAFAQHLDNSGEPSND